VSANLSALIPQLQPFARELLRAAGAAGLQPRVTSTLRTYAEQKRLYDRYLAGMSPYPAAPPGHSAHEYGYAVDIISLDQESLGDYWESLGGIWGGRIGDDVHFEYPGFSAPEIQEPIKAAGLLDVVGTASGFIGLPFALLSAIEVASSREAAEHIIDEYNYLTGSHVPYTK